MGLERNKKEDKGRNEKRKNDIRKDNRFEENEKGGKVKEERRMEGKGRDGI